jgi:hypothetical protein
LPFIQNIVEWFRSLSNGLKVLVIIVGVVVAFLASRAVYVIAALVFVIGLVVLILRTIRRRPLRKWAIVTVSALSVAIVFGNISGASNEGATPPQRESATAGETTEKAKQDESEPVPPAPAPEEKAEAKPKPAKSEEKQQPKEEPTAEIGESVEVDEAVWIVTDARRATQISDQFGGIMPPKQGNFVVVDFRFKNNSNKAKTLHSGALKLVDEDGREADPDTDTFSYIPQERNIFLEQVNPGVSKDAEVIFSVAADASGFNLRLKGTSLFSLEEPKEVALGF